METIQLNEANKFKWHLSYIALSDNGQDLITLAEGRIFDFVPNENDQVKFNGVDYIVIGRKFDFDRGVIWIKLSKEKSW